MDNRIYLPGPYSESETISLVAEGIKRNLKFFSISSTSDYIELTPSDLYEIKRASPGPAYISYGNDDNTYLRITDLLVDRTEADKIVAKLNKTNRRISSYSTKALKILDEVIEEFWEGHDPKYPTKSEAIVDWIVTEKKTSPRQAAMIDEMARSDEAKKGGNKKVKGDTQKIAVE